MVGDNGQWIPNINRARNGGEKEKTQMYAHCPLLICAFAHQKRVYK